MKLDFKNVFNVTFKIAVLFFVLVIISSTYLMYKNHKINVQIEIIEQSKDVKEAIKISSEQPKKEDF